MASTALLLDITLEGCDAELYVNDIPVGRILAAAGGGIHQVDHLLVRGANTFEVLLNPGSTPSVARTEKRMLPGDGVAVEVTAARCPPGTSPGEVGTTRLFRFGERLPGGPVEFPRSVKNTFEVDPPNAAWAWERADVLLLDPALLREATQYVQSLHGSLARKSFPGFWAHNEIAHREVAAAYDVPLAERQAAAEAAMARRFADPAFAMAPLVAEQFDYRLVANGRLLECIAKDWGAVVRTEPDSEGKVMRFPIMVGRIDGSLRGLR
ncbi:MAG: hypothetical protein KA978_03015 [Deltaproteobacteria bacterium]|nr:hypothetical protein [Deltaproteobacteria bacterium]MBP6829724.1 hypothetical protein [Deltaproteobacteria bacterium]